MQELVNLSKIVTKRRQLVLPLLKFAPETESRSREEQLLSLLVAEDGAQLSNLQIAKKLYGSGSAQNLTAVRKLKERLQQKLLNHLFFLDHSDPRHPVFRRYEQQCQDLLYQANTLWREGERVILPWVLRKLIRLATEGEFTARAISAWEIVRAIAVQANNYPDYRKSVRELERLNGVLRAEQEAEHLYLAVKMSHIRSVTSRRRLLQTLPATIEQLRELYQQFDSYSIYDVLLKVQLIKEELAGDFDAIVRLTNEAEQHFAAAKLNAKRFDTRFNKYYNLYAHLRARKLTEGLAVAEGYLAAFHRSSNNWFSFMENYYLLAMHAGDYKLASELLQRQQQNSFVTKISLPAQQRWELMRAYLHFVVPTEAAGLRPLHFVQLVQRIPDHSRDKQGYNVAILILQFLYYLRQGDIEALLLRLEGLRKYESAHLRDAATLRSRLMFRLLQLTVKENFNPGACEKKGRTLLTRLQETPPPGEAFAEIEIIPYENLWQLTLELLHQQAEQRAQQDAALLKATMAMQPSTAPAAA